MLVMIAGTMTIASACDGGIVTASSPIDTVGSPSPITPLTKPASRNAAAIRINRGSNMPGTLPDRCDANNLQEMQSTPSVHDGALAVQQLDRSFMHARIAGGDNSAAALRGLSVPGGNDAAG